MPTKERLNISLTDSDTINELKKLRKELQIQKDIEEISFASIIRALVKTRHLDEAIIKAL